MFCDTETTGVNGPDRLVQLATMLVNGTEKKTVNELFNPGMPISIGAMSVNHITNKMVEKAPVFKGGPIAETLQEQLSDPEVVFVAHNAPFDISMIEKEGVKVGKFVCTLKVAKHLDPKGVIERYNLQYLRYYFGFEIEATAHDALGDVLVLEKLFEKEQEALCMKYPDMSAREVVDEMVRLTNTPVLLPRITFGKHKGEPFSKVPRSYMIWALKNMDNLDTDVHHTMTHYLANKHI